MPDWFYNFAIAQFIGILASCFAILAYSVKCDVKTKRMLMLEVFLLGIHFAMMGAFTAMGIMIVNILRVWFSIQYHNSSWLCIFFVLSYIVVGSLMFENLADVLVILAPIVSTFAMYYFKGIRFRTTCLVASISWLMYGLIIGSIGLIITQVFVLSANTITIFKLKKDMA